MDSIVLAYSGGLDTSVAIPWLAEQHDAQIVTVTMDLGQGKELEDARERALALGAVRAHVLDLRAEFARDFILPALQAGAVYEDRYPLATALGRPLIAKHLVEIAHLEGASAVAHGCGAEKGNDAVRIDLAVRALDPDLTVLAPLGQWDVPRSEKVAYAKARGIPVPLTADSPYSTDANLWGRSIECGVLDDPWREPPEEIYQLTRATAEAPDIPAYVEVEFDRGVPVAINGVSMPLVELIVSLETIAGAHGIGRIDMLENRLGDTKSREIYEAPAGVLLHAAHRELQKYVTPRDLARLASDLSVKYADLVYNGQWYTPTREAIDALVAKVQQRVTGAMRLKLFKGDFRVVGRQSPFALYDQPGATENGRTVET
ncbi:MAG: argininosuccinate synthase [Acidobacteriota bacterium]